MFEVIIEMTKESEIIMKTNPTNVTIHPCLLI